MKKIGIIAAGIIMPIWSANAIFLVHPRQTSAALVDGPECADMIDWDNCTLKSDAPDYMLLTDECKNVCGIANSTTPSVGISADGNVEYSIAVPQVAVWSECLHTGVIYCSVDRWNNNWRQEAIDATCAAGYGCARCVAGYYGTPSGIDDQSACTQCPSSGGIAATSTPGSNTTKGSCYIPSGTTFSDERGGGVFSENCAWTE